MLKKSYLTDKGPIRYWISSAPSEKQWLVLLPGLTVDHRLFDKQIGDFKNEFNLFVWDAPAHNESRPFELDFSLADKAKWLYEILVAEGIEKPVLIGQSMGGYVSQALMEAHPAYPAAFVSIDSAPLQKKYMKNWEIETLKHMKPMLSVYTWKALKKSIAGCAETKYGRELMYEMMDSYDKKEYCELAAHGYRILAEAIEANLPYELSCPTLLICGEKDKAGSTKRYNRRWTAEGSCASSGPAAGENPTYDSPSKAEQEIGLPIKWIPDAGHNSNTDKPEIVNTAIREFIKERVL